MVRTRFAPLLLGARRKDQCLATWLYSSSGTKDGKFEQDKGLDSVVTSRVATVATIRSVVVLYCEDSYCRKTT
jgi:hypothetical protein